MGFRGQAETVTEYASRSGISVNKVSVVFAMRKVGAMFSHQAGWHRRSCSVLSQQQHGIGLFFYPEIKASPSCERKEFSTWKTRKSPIRSI